MKATTAREGLLNAAPTLYFICPELSTPVGGVHMIYRHVDLLNEAGFDAFVLHATPGFRVRWFPNETRVAYVPQQFSENDIVVFPEVEGPFMAHTAVGCRKVIFNQNAYFTFRRFGGGEIAPAPPYVHPDVIATITVSDDSRAYLEHAFPGLRVHRVRYCVDPDLYHARASKRRQIAFMPRKHAYDAEQVVNILRSPDALRGFASVAIEGVSQDEAARVMRESMVFLSFGHPEGFGLPAAEAMACGCITIGYHGNGGREFFTPDHGFPINVGDIIGYAKTVEQVLRTLDGDPRAFDAMTHRAAKFIRDTYSPEHEKADVLACWREILGMPSGLAAMPALPQPVPAA